VLLVYQHHFVDVWTGALVGVFCLYIIPDAPFNWRWQAPTLGMQKIGLRYLLGATAFLLIGLLVLHTSWLASALLLWSALALMLVAAAYFGLKQRVFQRYKGTMRWPACLLLAPYLLGSYISYRYYIRKIPAYSHIHGNIWLGAFPRAKASQPSWTMILDLTNEFTHSPLGMPPIDTQLKKYLPLMDLVPPTPKLLVKAIKWLDYAQQKSPQGNVLVHCALGLSRSASVVVCWLVWRGHAASLQEAIAQVNARRAGLVFSQDHLQNMRLALKQLVSD
jgi:Dual specificity phosphatase, catalytic domain